MCFVIKLLDVKLNLILNLSLKVKRELFFISLKPSILFQKDNQKLYVMYLF